MQEGAAVPFGGWPVCEEVHVVRKAACTQPFVRVVADLQQLCNVEQEENRGQRGALRDASGDAELLRLHVCKDDSGRSVRHECVDPLDQWFGDSLRSEDMRKAGVDYSVEGAGKVE